MKKGIFSLSALALTTSLMSATAFAGEEVNIYSNRQANLLNPILEQYTKDTGVKVNIVFAKKGLADRMKREGRLSKADLLLTTDISRLVEAVESGVTQPVSSDVLEDNIPAQYRDPDGEWFALTTRVRNIYTSREVYGDVANITYEELADPKFKGQICMRSGKHPYNVALISSMISHHGEAEAKEWLKGLKANLARKPQGNDRAQVKAIKEGVCTVALGNSYYLGKMLKDPKQVAWAESVNINFPNQENHGAHVNVSGMVLAKYAPNKGNAVKLMEYLSGAKAQQMYAEVNMEYPVKAGIKASELVSSWGEFNADYMPVAEIAKHRKAALRLLDEVKFDL
ncbi:iron(III) ABC transporter, periplasmic iron(III)-binding protein [Moritella sp. PE36]|uniref:Fe(3+) ABC transporter substrate-binding protein n=1 Tax=Moritella sp. PE36 TaxID=58051 RepID=UPI00015681CD|nr:Fe(3+) ABC transporter substrate-binding protein [Moritella sp. PE36]EDM69349.1 iron(III) ABC transporter, periplasmic iron(III)-binding protein [Moritella sp. PE36]